eukprot:97459-Chlamydomonas_euryale.AAC.4
MPPLPIQQVMDRIKRLESIYLALGAPTINVDPHPLNFSFVSGWPPDRSLLGDLPFNKFMALVCPCCYAFLGHAMQAGQNFL